MASILKVDELQGITSAGDITVTSEGGAATMQLQQGLAKAKVSYDGNNNTIRSSFNTSSVADTSSGRYYWNNSSAFTDTNTGVLSGATHRSGTQSLTGISGVVQRSTTQWDLNAVNQNAAQADAEVGALGTGDLA